MSNQLETYLTHVNLSMKAIQIFGNLNQQQRVLRLKKQMKLKNDTLKEWKDDKEEFLNVMPRKTKDDEILRQRKVYGVWEHVCQSD